MSKSVKAVLISVLVYPGLGHIFLKRYIAGCAFVTLFSLPLFILINDIIDKTSQVIKRVENGDIQLDIVSITQAVSPITSGSQTTTIYIYAMIAIWLISALDAYRVGKT